MAKVIKEEAKWSSECSHTALWWQMDQQRDQMWKDKLGFPITIMNDDKWKAIPSINEYLGEMLGAEVRRFLRLLSVKVEADLGGTAQQAKKSCNVAFVSEWIMATSRYEKALPTGTAGCQRVSGWGASGRIGPWMQHVCSAG